MSALFAGYLMIHDYRLTSLLQETACPIGSLGGGRLLWFLIILIYLRQPLFYLPDPVFMARMSR